MAKTEYAFGLHAVQSLLKTQPDRIQSLIVLRGRTDQRIQKVLASAKKMGISIQLEERKKLDALVEGNHQGLVALVSQGKTFIEKDLDGIIEGCDGEPFILILDGVTDPHNLGACLRSADAAGVNAVVIPKDNSASLNETARKVASGAADQIPLIAVTNLARTMKKLQELGLWITGAAGEAQQSIYEANLTGRE